MLFGIGRAGHLVAVGPTVEAVGTTAADVTNDWPATSYWLRRWGVVAGGELGALAVFDGYRRLLLRVAYRILGSVGDAEDVVQEAWLKWHRVDHSQVMDARAYLVRVVTSAAVDLLRRAYRQRETYIGPWLPEPVPSGDDAVAQTVLADSVSMAMLVVLETLSPLERAVFVLHETFAFTYPEIAAVIGRSEQAVRQVAHRARGHVQARRPRFQTDPVRRRLATERFLAAAVGGDLAGLLEALAPEVTLWADGGGKVLTPRRPIHGAGKVASFLAKSADGLPAGAMISFQEVNGGPAAVATHDGTVIAVFVVDVDPTTDQILAIRIVTNPDKLTTINRAAAG
jgi:RNA polymerase sigma-70 factor (ECF subfamily)